MTLRLMTLLTLALSQPLYAVTYTYDKLHRLTAVRYDSGDRVYYNYDPAGNLLGVTTAMPYTVSGTVTGDTPLAGVSVSLGGDSTLTDADGYFLFTDLQPGVFTLQLTADGYLAMSRTVTLDEEHTGVALDLVLEPRPPVRPVLFAGVQSCANNSNRVSANRIRVYTPAGEFIRAFDTGFTGKGIVLSRTDFDADTVFDTAAAQIAKGSEVYVFGADGRSLGALLFDGDTQGIQAVFADLSGDGREEILIASRAKTDRVHRYHSDGSPDRSLTLLDKAAAFKPAAGDLDGDGRAEILLALSAETKGSNVFVFDADGTPRGQFAALAAKGRAPGVTIAVADMDGDGRAEILTAPAEKNAGFAVAVYRADGRLLNRFDAFPPDNGTPPDLAGCTDYAGTGLILTAGDSDGRAAIFAAINGGREVRVFTADGELVHSFAAGGADEALSGLSVGSELP